MKYSNLLSNNSTWLALERAISQLPEPKDRGNAFEEFCYYYLTLLPEYQIKTVWMQGQLPLRIIKALNLSGQKDQGIDLVAETNSGKLWAIQAKFRSNRKSIVSYKELSTFLAISDRADYRLIISNTEQLPSIVGKRSLCGETLIDRLISLDNHFFGRLQQSIAEGKPGAVARLSPRPHQVDAITAAKKHFQTNTRGQLIMACGSGKTLTAVWIAESLKAHKILVMVPSLALMRQTVTVWANNLKTTALNYMCICSDASVADDVKHDQPIGHLWEMDIPVTTDPQEAQRFILDNAENPLIIFSTYQSSEVLSKSISALPTCCFDLTICDEAHRTAGTTKSLFNLVLEDKFIPSHKRLFMTATPRILDKHILKKGMAEDVDLFSMSDKNKYGEEFYRLSFGQAIKLKLLCDYKVVIAVVSDDEVMQVLESGNNIQIDSESIFESDAENLGKQIAFIKAADRYQIKHTISFHSRVKQAHAFTDIKSTRGMSAVNAIMKNHQESTPLIKTFHVNGAIPSGQRSAIIDEFTRSTHSVISNARCLTEGVDIPSVDGVMFYDPKYRLTDIVQATGRALRLFEGKNFGYLVIPVFLQRNETADDLLEASAFSQVWSVIKAMQSQDERLDEVIKILRVVKGQIDGGTKNISGEKESLENALHERFLIQGLPKRIDPERFMKKINVMLLDKLGSSWNYQFGLLKSFILKNPNRWPIQTEEFPKGNRLGLWCVNQRQNFKKGKLSQERFDLLNKIEFRWDDFDAWTPQYENLKLFRKANPSSWPIQTEEFPKGNRLGAWCGTQRQDFKKGKLSQERVDLLNKIEFLWDARLDVWTTQYENLKLFRKANPSSWPIQTEEFPKGNRLGLWCVNQRQDFKKGKLSQERVDLLNKIEFLWDARLDVWTTQYENLKLFRKANPNRWPKKIEPPPKGNRLGAWCGTQRQDFKKGKLSQERVDLLNKIEFRWDDFDAWTPQYENLKLFRKANPNRWPKATEQFPKGNLLGSWYVRQRKDFKKGKLSQERVDLLNKIEFLWDALLDAWTTQYENLKLFRKANPSSWPIQTEEFPKGNRLGAWCGRQRKDFKKGKLSQERVDLLNKIEFLWDALLDAWTTQYENLKLFRKANPSSWPIQTEEFPKGNRLGDWCGTQRKDFKKGKLSQERVDLLNKIEFLWDARLDAWTTQYENLKLFRKANPSSWPIQTEEFPKGNQLGTWCATQRENLKKEKLTEERINLLNQIGFPWNATIQKKH